MDGPEHPQQSPAPAAPPADAATTRADMYQSPPKLTETVTAEQLAAIQGPALSYAKNVSHTASILSGTIASALAGWALIPAKSPGRLLKIASGTVLGGGIGYLIGNMPWLAQPRVPLTAPAPDAAVASPAHDGKIEASPHEARTV